MPECTVNLDTQDGITVGLGIHSTLDLSGQVRFGPDTLYINNINYDFDNLKKNQLREGFITAIKQYYPELDDNRLHASYSGIRPKLSNAGDTARNFLIQTKNDHKVEGLINLFGKIIYT